MPLAERVNEVAHGYVFENQSLRILSELTRHEWEDLGREIVIKRESSTWALGDWLVYGNARSSEWGQMYKIASKVTGYTERYLSGAARVSEKYPPGVRIPSLTWSHHRLAMAVPRENRMNALKHAAFKELPLTKFEEYLNEEFPRLGRDNNALRFSGSSSQQKNKLRARDVECPNCHTRFPVRGNKVGIRISKPD